MVLMCLFRLLWSKTAKKKRRMDGKVEQKKNRFHSSSDSLENKECSIWKRFNLYIERIVHHLTVAFWNNDNANAIVYIISIDVHVYRFKSFKLQQKRTKIEWIAFLKVDVDQVDVEVKVE